MNDPSDASTPVEIIELDELALALLGAGAVLSQLISHMVAFNDKVESGADGVPIPALARGLIGNALYDLRPRFADSAVRAAAAIVEAATEAIVENIYRFEPADLN